jgi:cytochrome c oxidase subunit III
MTEQSTTVEGLAGVTADWSADRQSFPVPWGKAMMWIFLLSDALTVGGVHVPLLLIAIMTFVLITSSGTMAMAVNYGYRRDRRTTALLMFATALLGATFVGMQAFEWTKLIVDEGIRPWGNPMGAPQFGSVFFMITGFHGLHVSCGVVYLLVVAKRVLNGFYDRKGTYETVEVAGLYWHFVDLVWVFIFALFYLW